MLPDIVEEVNIDEIVENETTDDDINNIGKSFLFDFEKGDFILQDGKLVEVEGNESIKIWIEKILRTEKFKFKIYERIEDTNEYGITLQDLITGYDYPLEFIKSEIEREISEALIKHPSIDSIEEWNIEKSNPVLKISFKVVLNDGNILSEEVSY